MCCTLGHRPLLLTYVPWKIRVVRKIRQMPISRSRSANLATLSSICDTLRFLIAVRNRRPHLQLPFANSEVTIHRSHTI